MNSTQEPKPGFIVLLVLMSSYQPAFTDDNGIMFFDDANAAQYEIDNCIADIEQAVKAGNMNQDSLHTQDDFIIAPACIIDPASPPPEQTILCMIDEDQYIMKRSDDDYTRAGNEYERFKYIYLPDTNNNSANN